MLQKSSFDVEAVDCERHGLAEDFPSLGDITVPHVAGDFGHLSQQAGLLRLAQELHNHGFLPRFQHLQHAAVGVVHDHRDELAVLFLSDNSSMPIRVIGGAGVVSR